MESVIERLNAVHDRMQARKEACRSGDAKRAIALAMTKLEESRMWFNVGMAHEHGTYLVGDVEELAFPAPKPPTVEQIASNTVEAVEFLGETIEAGAPAPHETGETLIAPEPPAAA